MDFLLLFKNCIKNTKHRTRAYINYIYLNKKLLSYKHKKKRYYFLNIQEMQQVNFEIKLLF